MNSKLIDRHLQTKILTSTWNQGRQRQLAKKMSSDEKLISRQTATRTCNGVTETTVTEKFQLPNGSVRTKVTTTKTTGNVSTGNCVQDLSHNLQDMHLKNKDKDGCNQQMHKHESSDSDSSSSDDDDDFNDFEKTCLKRHNHYRAMHGVQKLSLSKSICQYSQEWANRIAKEDTLRHRQDHKYGENIFMSYNSDKNFDVKGDAPVDSWYSEIKSYKFGNSAFSMSTGHFTQVVWKDSKKFGIGKAKSKSGKIFVVANYDPPGNYQGRFGENVFPPKK